MCEIRRRVLIVDDNPENIKVVANTLQTQNLELAFALSGTEALARLDRSNFDLILMDVMMPGIDGFETVRLIRQNAKHDQVPIIFLTAVSDEASIEKAFAIGGADYLCKPFRPRELIARVRHQLERKDFIEQLEFLASRDMLTGIFNRRMFFQVGEKLFQQSDKLPVAMMIDVDHFKQVNDRHGHEVGDRVLKSIASAIDGELPADAVLGRIGGEEFAVLLLVTDADFAFSCAESIRDRVSGIEIRTTEGAELTCTVSIGIGIGIDGGVASIDGLLKVADDNLYLAKGEGRNRTILRGR